VLGKSRRWLYYRRRAKRTGRKCRRPEVEQAVERIVAGLPATYGYRRIHALLLRDGLRVNSKTVWRILRRRGWLSSTRSHAKRMRRHEGRVSVLEPNRRWASDITGIKAWNGEKGRLAVLIDCADRTVLTWRFGRRMLSEELQEMVREAVFQRFGNETWKARNLEFLSDNGPEYACRKLRALRQDFGMVICRTPRRSPESNGLAEAFFGSFKRDYVNQQELSSLEEIARQIPEGIKDYNEAAPHSALGMKPPMEFHADWMSKISTTPAQI
jgi:putative transposase